MVRLDLMGFLCRPFRRTVPVLLAILAIAPASELFAEESAKSIAAFPGAMGYGASAVGGRGGRVIEVINLNDSGPGSLRDALEMAGPRTVVFRVGGIIELNSRIDIQHPYLTIAGQTAPGGGITLKGTEEGGGQMLRVRTHDVVIRYLTIRSGAHGDPGHGQINIVLDPLPARGDRYGEIYNVVIDHVSVSWTLDENLAIFRNVPESDPSVWETWPRIYDVSVQRCLIAEGLYPHSTGLQIGGERIVRDGEQVYNGGWAVTNIDIHHNLFANTSHRNPGLGGGSVRVINNVMYNWGTKCGETHDKIRVDWIRNYFKPGRLTSPGPPLVHNDFFKHLPERRFAPPSIYLSGNYNAGAPDQSGREMYEIHYENRGLPDHYFRTEPLQEAPRAVKVDEVEHIMASVLGDVGANAKLTETGAWERRADAADLRILDDVRNGDGTLRENGDERTHYSHPDQVGGYPTISPGEPYEDADHDGMADRWERLHGFDPSARNDRNQDEDGDGYTNLEEFLNGSHPVER